MKIRRWESWVIATYSDDPVYEEHRVGKHLTYIGAKMRAENAAYSPATRLGRDIGWIHSVRPDARRMA